MSVTAVFEEGGAAFWTHEGEACEAHRIFPDGCVDLVVKALRVSDGSLIYSDLFVVGPMRRAHVISIEAQDVFIGVRFRPGLSRLTVDADPTDLIDRQLSAPHVDSSFGRLADRLAEARDAPAMLDLLRLEVRRRLCAGDETGRPPTCVQEAIALLGSKTVRQVAQTLGRAERSVHRDVAAWTGLTPKTLARIFRFQKALTKLRGDSQASLALTAHDVGYADQAHMTREFRSLGGLSPSAVR